VLRSCGKLRGSTSCEVQCSTSLQPNKNLYVCACVCSSFFGNSVCFNTERDLYQWLAAMMLAQVSHSFSPVVLITGVESELESRQVQVLALSQSKAVLLAVMCYISVLLTYLLTFDRASIF